MINVDTALYILGGLTTVASSLGAYFSQRNHSKLNGKSTISITSQPITMAALTTAKTIIVDGITYVEVK
jgi:hypothetical protein